MMMVSPLIFMAQELNENALDLKQNNPTVYQDIKILCEREWKGDHQMMVFTINQQSDAMVKLMELSKKDDFDWSIYGKAAVTWSEIINGRDITDYAMVLFEYENQLKASKQY